MKTESTELMVIDAQNAVQIFTGGGMAAILDDLKAAREKAKRDSEAAVAKERERVERERKAESEERAKRAADESLRLRIRAEILEDLNSATCPADAIMDGRVRHVRVVF